MSGLEALLITSIEDELPLTKLFPSNFTDQKALTEILIITQNFKACGKGSLQHKNKIFYYRTYIPSLHSKDDNSLTQTQTNLSDYFIYSYDCSKKKFFLLFLCDFKYKKKDIDNLTNEIFDILDNNAFEGHDIKIECCHKINTIFEQYRKLQPNFGKINQLKEMDIIDDSGGSLDSIKDLIKEEDNKKKKLSKKVKRIDSRLVIPKKKPNKSSGFSVDIDDLTTLKESDSDLSIMFGKNFDKDLAIPQVNKWRIIKIINIILCSLFCVISIIMIILLLTIF
jgi:Holliday junction resolvase RusA-like endonuclease